MPLPQLVKVAETFAKTHSTSLLSGVGVAAAVSAALLTGHATIKATRFIDEENRRLEDNNFAPLTKRETVVAVWPYFVPPAVTLGVGVTAIVFSTKIGNRRAAALAGAYALSQEALQEYKEKVIEKIGKNKEREIRDDILQDRVNNTPVPTTVIITGTKQLCYDKWSGQYFENTMEDLKHAQNAINNRINRDFYASLNDYYDQIGVHRVQAGDDLGWNSDELLEVYYGTAMSDDNRPCIAIEFVTRPRENYFRTH